MTTSTPAGRLACELVQLRLHAADDVQRVLAVAHDDDAADRVALAVEVADAAPRLRPELDRRHVAYPERHARGLGAQDDVAEVVERPRVAADPHHVLGAAPLDEPPAALVVRGLHRRHDLADRDAVGGQPVRVDDDLHLLDVAADRGDLGDAGDALQGVAQRPVLDRAQLVERVRVAVRSTSAYW